MQSRLSCAVLLGTVALVGAGVRAEGPPPKGEFQVRGIGGAGGMFTPSISPYDPNLMLLSCDMSGAYRSIDGGRRWELIHYRQISSSLNCRPVFLQDSILWASGTNPRITRDKGATWKPLSDSPPPWKDPITHLAAGEGAPRILVGTAGGLWSSSDSGRSWEQHLSGRCFALTTAGPAAYASVKTADEAIAGYLWRSGDAGKTWKHLPVPEAKDGAILSVAGAVDKGGASCVYVAAEKVGILQSTDGGGHWRIVQEWKQQRDLLMPAGQTQVAYACQMGSGSGEIWRTADAGKTWESIFRMTGPSANVERSWVQTQLKWGYQITQWGLGINPADPDVVMVSTQGDLYISTDGGRKWRQIMNRPVGVLPGDPGYRYQSVGLEVTSCWGYYFDPWDSNRHYIAYTDIGFARSVDRGAAWTWSAEGCPWSNTFYEIAFDPHVKGRMYAATSNRHDIPHWTHTGDNAGPHAVGGVCVSDNQAVKWQVLGTGLPKLPCTSICIDPRSPEGKVTIYATLYEGGLYKSTDGGATWTGKSKGLGNPGNLHACRVRLHPKSGNLYCLITAHRKGDREFPVPGGLWRSTDGGESWTDLTAGLKLRWPTNLALHPTDENTIYVTAATAPGYREGGVYKTTDGGKTWKRVLTDDDFAKWTTPSYVHCMFVQLHPENPEMVYVGGGHGLWFSKDGGQTFEVFEKFPFRGPQSVAFDPADRKVLFVTTFGAGVWKGYYLPVND